MRRLAEIDRGKLIDLLRERLAFERESACLYDAVVERLEGAEPALRRIAPRLERQRDEEREHAAWLEAQLRGLAAAMDEEARRVRLVHVENEGIERVIGDRHATVAEALHALAIAERGDESGWRILLKLAEAAGDDAAVAEFGRRHAEEELHVRFLERALIELARNEVLGTAVTMPIDP